MDSAVIEPWKKIQVPSICERLIGFSIPRENRVLIISYEGIHTLHLGNPIIIDHDYTQREYNCYDPDTGIAHYQGSDYKIIGLYAGNPLLNNPQGENLELNHNEQTFEVYKDNILLFKHHFQDFSRDWSATTFSPDGHWMLLGCAYDFDFLVFRRS